MWSPLYPVCHSEFVTLSLSFANFCVLCPLEYQSGTSFPLVGWVTRSTLLIHLRPVPDIFPQHTSRWRSPKHSLPGRAAGHLAPPSAGRCLHPASPWPLWADGFLTGFPSNHAPFSWPLSHWPPSTPSLPDNQNCIHPSKHN